MHAEEHLNVYTPFIFIWMLFLIFGNSVFSLSLSLSSFCVWNARSHLCGVKAWRISSSVLRAMLIYQQPCFHPLFCLLGLQMVATVLLCPPTASASVLPQGLSHLMCSHSQYKHTAFWSMCSVDQPAAIFANTLLQVSKEWEVFVFLQFYLLFRDPPFLCPHLETLIYFCHLFL